MEKGFEQYEKEKILIIKIRIIYSRYIAIFKNTNGINSKRHENKKHKLIVNAIL